jgi:hypothetical protein
MRNPLNRDVLITTLVLGVFFIAGTGNLFGQAATASIFRTSD